MKLDSREQSTLNVPNLEVNYWVLSPDGNQVFVWGARKITSVIAKQLREDLTTLEKIEEIEQVRGIFNVQTKKWVSLPIEQLDGAPREVCFTSDSKRLIAIATQTAIEKESNKVSLHQFDVATGMMVAAPIEHPAGEQLREMTVSPDGKWLAIIRGQQNMRLHLVDLATGKERPTTAPEHVALPTFSPDSKTLAIVVTGYNLLKHEVQIIDLVKGQSRATLKDWGTFVHTLAFSPDSRTLAVGGGNFEAKPHTYRDVASMLHEVGHATGELRLYDSDTGNAIASLGGHADIVTCLAFDESGARLATGGLDRSVKIWDIAAALKSAKENTPAPESGKPVAAAAPKENTPSDAEPKATTPPSNAATKPTSASSKSATNSLGMRFITIPAGEFLMGVLQNSPEYTEPSESPQHKVHISKPLSIGVHEVTVGQFRAFVDATGFATDAETEGAGSSGYDAATKTYVQDNWPEFTWKNIGIPQSDDCPVTNVSWNDAKAFCVWLSGKEGKRYRLPSEAELEYCCRAGASTRFPTGDGASSVNGIGNIGDAALRQKWPQADWTIIENDGYAFTAPVGKFKANAWGIYDMIGNVSEWCEDWHDPNYYSSSPAADPRGPSYGEGRVVRGGSWFADPSGQRAAMRVPGWPPTWRSMILGFRVVCD